MSPRLTVGWLLALLLAPAGCSNAPPPAGPARPAAAAPGPLTAARLVVRRFPEEADVGAAPRCSVLVNDGPTLAEIEQWLDRIDWSQKGVDMAAITMPAPDGSLEVTAEGGATSRFAFYWTGRFLNGNRYIHGGDMAELRRIVQKACK